MPIISIIIPVYNVEKYIYRCIDSILAQTFTDFECILINDGSTDNSPAICDKYANNDKRFKVIHKKQNEGLPKARKSGLDTAVGEYILHIDSDDWIEKDMLEKLYTKAIYGNFDMVWCDYYENYKENYKYFNSNVVGLNKIDIYKKLLCGKLHSGVWNKLVKRTIYINNNIYFSPANQWEDFTLMVQIIYYAENIGYVDKALYHYRINMDSLSFDEERVVKRIDESYENLSMIIDFIKEKYGNLDIFEPELSYRVNGIKKMILRTKEVRDIKKLFSLYPESHKYIFDKRIHVHPLSRIFLFLAAKKILFPYKIFDVFFPANNRFLRRVNKKK